MIYFLLNEERGKLGEWDASEGKSDCGFSDTWLLGTLSTSQRDMGAPAFALMGICLCACSQGTCGVTSEFVHSS